MIHYVGFFCYSYFRLWGTMRQGVALVRMISDTFLFVLSPSPLMGEGWGEGGKVV